MISKGVVTFGMTGSSSTLGFRPLPFLVSVLVEEHEKAGNVGDNFLQKAPYER
jgi:hypothetical protein